MKAIPILPAAVVALSVLDAGKKGAWAPYGTVNAFVEDWTSYNMDNGNHDVNIAKKWWVGAVIAILVHKVATKTGVNRYAKKLSMGYATL